MTSLRELRAGKRAPYPDQAIYLELACRHHGVAFAVLDGDGGTVVRVGDGAAARVIATTGRTCVYPGNSAAAMALATDKLFTRIALDACGVPNLGGEAFFLDGRFARMRRPGHELADARARMEARGHVAFCKPLAGSRGDFAERVTSREGFESWLARVSRAYDAVLLQDLFEGDEYRVFLVGDEVVFVMQRSAPTLRGDGASTVAALHAAFVVEHAGRGVSDAPLDAELASSAGRRVAPRDVLAEGERVTLAHRRNASAGAALALVSPESVPAVVAAARAARAALGLAVAGVDVMATADGARVIELNGNAAIAGLEALGRDDLVVRLWGAALAQAGITGRV